ncbi:MAG: hypothetical protein WCP69_12410 [Bacteroidota bacterium]
MINVGGVDVIKELINLEHQVGTLERMLIEMNNRNANIPGFRAISQEEYDKFKTAAGEALIAKYPQLGLKIGGNE